MKRIVLKVGSAVLTENYEIAEERMLGVVQLVAELKKTFDVILVTAGAAAAGYSTLKLDKRNKIGKKALAAAGQPILMSSYKKMLDFYEIDTAQILLTEDDFDSHKRTRMFCEIINAHLANDMLPIISENDITSTPDQLFNGNDLLAAHITLAAKADLLVMLSDIDGYYDKDPHKHQDAKRQPHVHAITKIDLEQGHSKPHAPFASGGIATKLKAADLLLQHGISMFLCDGFNLAAASQFLINGEQTQGTLFHPPA